jgi:hypothetical protein
MFKVGDKIVCVNNNIKPGYGLFITIGNVYDVIVEDDGVVTIIDDTGENSFYNEARFVSLIEYRKLKIEKICLKLEIK